MLEWRIQLKYKKLSVLIALLSMILFITACKQGDTSENSILGAAEDYLEYFQPLVEQWEKDSKKDFPLLAEYNEALRRCTDSGAAMEAMSYIEDRSSSETEYRLTKIKLRDGRTIENAAISLKLYGGIRAWFADNVYYNEATDEISVLFNLSPEGIALKEQEVPFLLLACFKVDAPQNYSITAYAHENREELWFSDSVGFGDKLYENLGIGLWQGNIWSIALETKELLCLKEETEEIREAVEAYFESAQLEKRDGGFLTCHVAYVKDDVTVYRGMLWYDNEETPFAVYLAYQGREYLGTMALNNQTGVAEMIPSS